MAQVAAKAGTPSETPGVTLDLDPEDEKKHTRVFSDDYEIGEKLAKGSFGTVFVAKHKGNGEEYAAKVIERARLKPKDTALVMREVSIMRECRDVSQIVQLVDFYRSDTQFFVVQVYAQGGDVFHRLAARTQYTEKDARDLALHLLQAMEVLHKRKIAHRDMKPENLLLRDMMDDSQILVADFGFARYVPEEGLKTRCGTPAFVGPEVLVQNCRYDERVDMWGVGCLLYMLIGGYPPFQDRSHQGLFRKIRGADFVFHDAYWRKVSVPAKQLISRLLTADPEHRATAELALQSEWFNLSNQALKQNDLSTSIDEIKRFHARRSLKGAMHAVLWSVKTKMRSLAALTKAPGGFDADTVALNGNVADADIQPQIRFDDKYELKEKLNEASATALWSCIEKSTGKEFSVKIVDRSASSANSGPGGKTSGEAVMHEVAVLNSLHHKHIIDIIEFFDEDNKYYLVTESMRGGDLFDRVLTMKKYTEKDARDLTIVLLQAVSYMHKQGIAHRDLKPQNLLLKSEDDHADIKVADFSFACRVHTPQSLTARCGTPSYVAPEVLKNIPYDQSADMWSVGVILYMLLSGCLPFADDNQSVLFQKIRTGDWKFSEYFDSVTEDAKDMIRHLLVVDPSQRWSADQCLQSEWLKVGDNQLSTTDLSDSLGEFKELQKKKASLLTMATAVRRLMSVQRASMQKRKSAEEITAAVEGEAEDAVAENVEMKSSTEE